MRQQCLIESALVAMPEAGLHTSGPSTGVPDLDEALDGLYWGDNVVW